MWPDREDTLREVEAVIVFVISLLSVVAVTGNVTLLLVLRSSERRNGRKVPSNVFIRNLALTDMLIGLLILPVMCTTVILDRTWRLSHLFCQVHGIMVSVLVNVSILSLTGIAADRYLAVVQPIYYKVILTKDRSRFIVFAFWIISLVIVLLPIGYAISYEYDHSAGLCLPKTKSTAGDYYLLISTVFTIIIPFIILSYCYIRIYTEFKVRSVQRQIYNGAKRLSIQVLEWGHSLHTTPSRAEQKGKSATPISRELHTVFEENSASSSRVESKKSNVLIYPNKSLPTANSEVDPDTITSELTSSVSTAGRMRKAEEAVNDFKSALKSVFHKKAQIRGTPKCMRNASVTARLIIVCFILCWSPYFCKTVYFLMDRGIKENKESWFLYFHITVFIISLSTCAWNPLIYLTRSRSYRKEIAKIIFFRLSNKASPVADVCPYPLAVNKFHRKLSVLAGIDLELPQDGIRKGSNQTITDEKIPAF